MTRKAPESPTRVAVLASGGGSNLGAILEHLDALGTSAAATVAVVASDRSSAHALQRATDRAIPAVHLGDPRDGRAITAMLRDHGVELIALAGYLRLIPPEVIRGYRGRIINVHPALLPAFGGAGMYGVRAHRAVIASGVRISGPTVHFVDEEYDRGPIIAQWPVPVLADDSAESLAARVLHAEHLLYPRVVQAVASGRIRLGADLRAEHVGGGMDGGAMFTLISNEAGSIARSIDLALG